MLVRVLCYEGIVLREESGSKTEDEFALVVGRGSESLAVEVFGV